MMIEAVNSVLQTASFVRASSEQVSTVDSFAANPDRVQKAPQAPFVSPFIYVDVNLNKAVIQLRNGETGDVEGQFPSQSTLEARARLDDVVSEPVSPTSPQSARGDVAPTASPAPQEQSAQVSAQLPDTTTTSSDSGVDRSAITVQQQAAFQAAAQSGNSNAGNVTLLA